MRDRKWILCRSPLCLFVALFLLTGCLASTLGPRPVLKSVDQINSPSPEIVCTQAREVVSNNPYYQEFFEEVFAKMVEQLRHSKSTANADLIWNQFIVPLRDSGKIPPDMAITTWNLYFSRQFVSLPPVTPVRYCCSRLAEIKKGLEKEFRLKKLGFEISQQGSPDYHFLNAMYVYNTLWAACESQ
jgi:hypothetical protein